MLKPNKALDELPVFRAGLRHARGVRPNRAAKFKEAAILDPTKINLPGMACIFVNSFR